MFERCYKSSTTVSTQHCEKDQLWQGSFSLFKRRLQVILFLIIVKPLTMVSGGPHSQQEFVSYNHCSHLVEKLWDKPTDSTPHTVDVVLYIVVSLLLIHATKQVRQFLSTKINIQKTTSYSTTFLIRFLFHLSKRFMRISCLVSPTSRIEQWPAMSTFITELL